MLDDSLQCLTGHCEKVFDTLTLVLDVLLECAGEMASVLPLLLYKRLLPSSPGLELPCARGQSALPACRIFLGAYLVVASSSCSVFVTWPRLDSWARLFLSDCLFGAAHSSSSPLASAAVRISRRYREMVEA